MFIRKDAKIFSVPDWSDTSTKTYDLSTVAGREQVPINLDEVKGVCFIYVRENNEYYRFIRHVKQGTTDVYVFVGSRKITVTKNNNIITVEFTINDTSESDDTDTTLTLSGVPADAKATGDAIDIINNILSEDITTNKLANKSITVDKLSNKLNTIINADLNNLSYNGNIALPVEGSYAEGVTYMNEKYYAVCRDYSTTPNAHYIAIYDGAFTLIDTVYISATYGRPNNIFNDGSRIYVDFDGGYHVSFDTDITDDYAVQNTNIRNMAFWNGILYGITINTTNVTVYSVESDFITITELFSVNTTRQTLQSASIIDGILFIPTTKGLFKYIDIELESIIAEIPYYDTKEIENFFKDKDGTIKCCGHFYGTNGVFNIGTFNGGVNGAKMEYNTLNGLDGDFSTFAQNGEKYGFYKITNGSSMNLPSDNGDLFLFNSCKLFISSDTNAIYIYTNKWNLLCFKSKIILYQKVDNTYFNFELTADGHFVVYSDLFNINSATITINIDLSSIYSALSIADGKSFTRYVVGTSASSNVSTAANEVYIMQIYVKKTKTQIFTRNVTQNSVSDEDINARLEFYATLK